MTRSLAAAAFVLAAAGTAAAQPAAPSERMAAWSKALGVSCTHCHVEGQWADESKPAFDFARRMSRMADGLSAGLLKEQGGVTCWTCHRGQPRPARIPPESWQAVQAAHTADFASRPPVALTMSVYAASLGVACSHCHDPADWASDRKTPHQTVARMLRIFDEIPTYFDAVRQPRTQCYMCHQGAVKPAR